MTTSRKQAPQRRSSAGGSSPLDSFSSFRRWLIGLLLASFGILGGIVIQADRARVVELAAEVTRDKADNEKDLRELRDRINAEYNGQVKATGDVSERLGRVETALADISKHIDSIDGKIR